MTNDADAITRMFETVSLGAPQNAIGFVMWRVMHRYQRGIDQALRPLDLTHLQFTTLALVAWMGRAGETATQSELARFGDIHPMQVSNVLKALEQKAMVARATTARNALAKTIAITPQGLRALRAAMPLAIEVQHRLFGDDGLPGGRLLAALAEIERRDDR